MSDNGNNGAAVAIVDYGLGNLYSVVHACRHVGLRPCVTSARDEILAAGAVILPGVGAFGDAMAILRQRDLVGVLRDVAVSDTPLVGICLGMQLLMAESFEFGRHRGLRIIEGDVVRLNNNAAKGGRVLKVPQIGWNRISAPPGEGAQDWPGTLLSGLQEGEHMYFVHSFVTRPEDPRVALSVTQYGGQSFCSSLRLGNIFASQFHPERSGAMGLTIYRNLAARLRRSRKETIIDAGL